DGDGRYLLNLIEQLQTVSETLDTSGLVSLVQQRAPVYDKGQEGHYNLISALHKSMRGSDPDASLYWLARMLDGGEDPLYIARPLAVLVRDRARPRCPPALHRPTPGAVPPRARPAPRPGGRAAGGGGTGRLRAARVSGGGARGRPGRRPPRAHPDVPRGLLRAP